MKGGAGCAHEALASAHGNGSWPGHKTGSMLRAHDVQCWQEWEEILTIRPSGTNWLQLRGGLVVEDEVGVEKVH